MNTIILQGLKITTTCKYVKFTESTIIDIHEDLASSYIEIKFPRGIKSCNIVDRHVKCLYETILKSTDYIKIYNPIVDLNGVRFKKLTEGVLNYSQYLVANIDDFLLEYDRNHITILIPTSKKDDLCTYLKCLKMIPMIQVLDAPELCELDNLYNLNIDKKDVYMDSDNKFVFNTKEFYDAYILRMVDVFESFKRQLEERLLKRGIQLLTFPVDEKLQTANHIVYRISELSTQVSRKTDFSVLNEAVQHRSTIEFELSTPNLILFNDVRTRYQNLNFISDFTEFYTKDKLGNDWISTAKWDKITTDFEADFSQDSKGNFAYKSTFNCELYYYVVFDVLHYKIREIIATILAEPMIGTPGEVYETDVIRSIIIN